MKDNLITRILPGKEEISCRHCGSTDVRPSHKREAGEGYVVYRCRACKQHFKVASVRPRLRGPAGVALFLIAVIGVAVGFYLRATPTVQDEPPGDMQNTQALAKARDLASKGDAQAQYLLGRMHWQKGEYAKSLPWLKAAADRGHAEAQYLLGQAYQYGRGTVQDFLAAHEQFTRAAEQGHLDAEYRLGIFYRDGLAGPASKETAYVWLNLAAAQGHADALILRDKVSMAMTGEEILRAQAASARVQKRLVTPAAATP
jgi:hypothetical protein